MEHFFMRQDYYTLIFDNRKQMNLVKDTTIDHVVVEKVFYKTNTVQQFLFNRINGQWLMTSINYKPMYANMNASFLKFYGSFATDSAFQAEHLHNPVKFTGPDPDDDFSTMTGDIEPDTVNEALRQLHADRDGAVYIGDSDVDVMTAKNSGMPCISVLWGFRDLDFLIAHGAHIFVSSPGQIAGI